MRESTNVLIVWNRIDKTDWPIGQWHGEPDVYKWHENELLCLIERDQTSGVLSIAVQIPLGHPLFGATQNRLPKFEDRQLTISKPDQHNPSTKWWIGLYFSDSSDHSPISVSKHILGGFHYGTYRNFEYARQMAQRLTKMLNLMLDEIRY